MEETKSKMKKVLFLLIVLVTLVSTLGTVLPGGASPALADTPPSLVGLWHFNGNTTDSSGAGNNGTFFGGTPTYSASPMGQALSFNGSQYVNVPDASTLDVTRVTLEAWIKPAVSTQTGYARIIFKGTNTPFRPLYFLAYDVTGRYMRMVVYIGGTAASNAKEAISTTALTDTSKWYYIVGTYDGTNVKIYINGILEGTTSVPSDGNIDNGTQAIGIGRNPESNVYGYKGLIDEAHIWNGALSFDQINDNTAPQISITTPADGAVYTLNQIVNANWSVTDGTGVGVKQITSTTPNGSPIDTSTVGSHTYTVSATDFVDNTATTTVTYTVNNPPSITVTPPSAISFGAFHRGENIAHSAKDGTVTVTGAFTSWSVQAVCVAPSAGYMMNGSTPLTDPLYISSTNGSWTLASTGINYGPSTSNPGSLPLWASQTIEKTDTGVGDYTVIITFTGSLTY